MTRGALVAALCLGLGLEALSAPPQGTQRPYQPIDLQKTFQALIRAASVPRGFDELGKPGSLVTHLQMSPRLPKDYVAHNVGDPYRDVRFVLASSGGKNGFAFVRTVWSTIYLAQGYRSPEVWLANVEQMIAPYLNKGYQRRELHNGVLYEAPGKPAVELYFVDGVPSESRRGVGYEMGLLVFRPRATILVLDDPCHWWTASPPPGGLRKRSPEAARTLGPRSRRSHGEGRTASTFLHAAISDRFVLEAVSPEVVMWRSRR
jgi:hypothetical protein